MKRPTALLLAILAVLGCSDVADELGELSPADTNCRALPPEVYARNPDVARGMALDLADTSRVLTIGVDSMNRLRVINASTHRKVVTSLTIHASSATFGTDGTMHDAKRTISTGDVETGLNSTSKPLSDTDASRLHALAIAAHERCTR